ncbi:MAG: Rpn family recombination-promoting nuclease/putative transposase [Blautia sp.]|nr:Rpn family recombination-promoting nuclease/putative transposase [Blautia sp.]
MHDYDNASLIFPIVQPLPQVLGEPRLKTEILRQIQSDSGAHAAFQALSEEERDAFLGFCMGNRGLKITYDPFFLHLFDPAIHPDRLNRLLSCILNQKVTVLEVLPRERRRISEDSSLIIMDILVQLSDNRLVNVEMQRMGYDFPIERGFCYGADLLVRQYDMVRKEYKDNNQNFSYSHIEPVYIIVFMEQSPPIFHKYPDKYMHRSQFGFDSGLKTRQLENFIYIPLDIFRQMVHNELTELDAWMYFLGSDHPEDILRIMKRYPFFQELYYDIVKFRYQPKELITMFSEALYIMDRNTVRYMVDELKAELSKKNLELSQKDSELSQKDSEIKRLRARLAQYEKGT